MFSIVPGSRRDYYKTIAAPPAIMTRLPTRPAATDRDITGAVAPLLSRVSGCQLICIPLSLMDTHGATTKKVSFPNVMVAAGTPTGASESTLLSAEIARIGVASTTSHTHIKVSHRFASWMM